MWLCHEREQKTSTDFAAGTRGQPSGMITIEQALAGILPWLWFDRPLLWGILFQGIVSAVLMVVTHVITYEPQQMSFV